LDIYLEQYLNASRVFSSFSKIAKHSLVLIETRQPDYIDKGKLNIKTRLTNLGKFSMEIYILFIYQSGEWTGTNVRQYLMELREINQTVELGIYCSKLYQSFVHVAPTTSLEMTWEERNKF
jgi:hypothetical protein